jgi:hypothetical protein
MDGIPLELPLFIVATFAGALVAGLSGFAFGLVAASIWLYILTPLQSASLIIAFGLIVQGYSVWKLRSALDWRRLWPFILGAALGVRRIDPDLGRSWPRSRRCRCVSCSLQPLCTVSSRNSAFEITGCRGRSRCRIPQRRVGRHCGGGRNPRHDLVRTARLDQGCAAYGVSTGRSGDLPGECAVDRGQRRPERGLRSSSF